MSLPYPIPKDLIEIARRASFPELAGWTGDTITMLIRRIAKLEVEIEMRDSTLSMAVGRLGGTVEGFPTQRHNFLQRIDELIGKEAENARLSAPVTDAEQAYYVEAIQPVGEDTCGYYIAADRINELIAARKGAADGK